MEVMGRLQTPASDLLNKIEAKNLVEPTELDGVVGWIPCDQIAAAALLDRSVRRCYTQKMSVLHKNISDLKR